MSNSKFRAKGYLGFGFCFFGFYKQLSLFLPPSVKTGRYSASGEVDEWLKSTVC